MIGRPPLGLVALAVLAYAAVHVVLAVSHEWKIPDVDLTAYYLGLTLMLLACVGGLFWPPAGLRRLWAWGLVAMSLTACLLVASVLRIPQPSYAMWYPSLVPVPLGAVALQGHPRLAITGAFTAAAVTLVWTDRYAIDGVIEGLYRTVTPTAAVVVTAGVWFAARASRAAVAAAHDEQVAAGERAAMLQARGAERADRLADAERLVTPVLTRLAAGERVNRRLARECELLEAGVRDGILARPLVDPTVATAAWAARARGVRVSLFADPSAATAADGTSRALSAVVARTLEVLPRGSVIARLAPAPQREPEPGRAGASDGNGAATDPPGRSAAGTAAGAVVGTVVVRSADAMSVAAGLRGMPGVTVDVDEDGALVTVVQPAGA